MNNEYEFLRKELTENIKKQDTISNLIFTILGVSFAFSTWYENIAFIIIIIFISAILLSKIIQCRNTVYYLATYMLLIEKSEEENISWESNFKQFRKKPYGLPLKFKFTNIINWFSFRIADIIKNFSNLALATFTFVRLIQFVINSKLNTLNIVIIFILGGCFYLLNVIFSIAICTDKKMRKEYENRWSEILKEDVSETSQNRES